MIDITALFSCLQSRSLVNGPQQTDITIKEAAREVLVRGN